MKKLVMFLLLVVILFSSYGQKANLTISHTLTLNSLSVLPDSIMVTNLTQGGDTTLYGADTSLALDYTTGIEEYRSYQNGIFVTPNYPNPFKDKTYFNVIVPESGQVSIIVCDITSRMITDYSANLSSGNYKFLLRTGIQGLYFVTVRQNNQTSSIKINCTGGEAKHSCKLSNLGSEANVNNKSIYTINSFSYLFGDELRSIVYLNTMTDTVKFLPTQDTLLVFNFQSPVICPSTFVDSRDSNIYSAVQIGSQCWMAENLNYSTSNSWCYDDNSANCDVYGRLYIWDAAMAGAASSNSIPSGVQGVCPAGWHLPSDEEWKMLEGEVDSQYGYPDAEWDSTGLRGSDVGGNLKETGYSHWSSPNTGATNSSGFTALPGGRRDGNGSFYTLGNYAYFWSSTESSSSYAWDRSLYFGYANVHRFSNYKDRAFSVRCTKD